MPISIHAAQEGCDGPAGKQPFAGSDFNPRSPRGLRLAGGDTSKDSIIISIHAAQEGCDKWYQLWILKDFFISIHAAQEGCDFVIER